MSLKAQIEAIIYAAEEPVTVDQIASVLKDSGEFRPSENAHDASADSSADRFPERFHDGLKDTGLTQTEGDAAAASDRPQRKADSLAQVKTQIRPLIDELIADTAGSDRGIEIRAIAGGYRIATKPEHHDVVRAFARSLKPPVRLSLPSLETLAVIAYKQPITVPEISEIRGVDTSGVIGTLLDRKLITTAGRKQVIGRPILYKTTREFLLRFGLKDLSELPSMEEFEKLMNEAVQGDLLPVPSEQTSAGETESSAAATAEPSVSGEVR